MTRPHYSLTFAVLTLAGLAYTVLTSLVAPAPFGRRGGSPVEGRLAARIGGSGCGSAAGTRSPPVISARSVGLDSSSSDRSGDKDPFTVFGLEVFEPDLRSMARIVVRPIGSPMPLGFFTVAIDTAPGSAT